MKKLIRIAFAGKQGVGKTTAASYLIKNYNFEKASFANKIKQVAMDLFNASYDEVYINKSKRTLLQDIGRKMRDIDKDVWTKYLVKEIENNSNNIVIDDVRMKSEFDALKELGFIMIKVECDKEICKSRISSFVNENDITETEQETIKDWNYILNNEKDFDHLHQQLNNIIKEYI